MPLREDDTLALPSTWTPAKALIKRYFSFLEQVFQRAAAAKAPRSPARCPVPDGHWPRCRPRGSPSSSAQAAATGRPSPWTSCDNARAPGPEFST